MSPTILPNILSTKTPPFHMTLTFSSTYVVKVPLYNCPLSLSLVSKPSVKRFLPGPNLIICFLCHLCSQGRFCETQGLVTLFCSRPCVRIWIQSTDMKPLGGALINHQQTFINGASLLEKIIFCYY